MDQPTSLLSMEYKNIYYLKKYLRGLRDCGNNIQYYLYIMPTLGLGHFLALWRGGIMAREVILACGYMTAD